MNIRNILLVSAISIIGIAIIVYGGYDDSPGAQLLGLVLIVFGVLAVRKSSKK